MAVYNITINQGENYDLTATLATTSGTAVDLTGYSLRGKIRYSYGYTGVIANLNPDVVSAISGIIHFALTPEQTASLPITIAVYDIEKFDPQEAAVSRVLQGSVTVTPEVTY
jgi:hypothetical protein